MIAPLLADDSALETTREALTARLAEEGLEGRDLSWVVQEEMKILSQIMDIADPEKKEAENHRLHVEQAKKMISAYRFDKHLEKYRLDCQERWEEWWFKPKTQRIQTLQDMFDAHETNEISARRIRGNELQMGVVDKMDALSQSHNMKVTHKARQTIYEAWQALLKTPLRLYPEARKKWVNQVKRMGLHSEALNYFEESIDKLFEDPA